MNTVKTLDLSTIKQVKDLHIVLGYLKEYSENTDISREVSSHGDTIKKWLDITTKKIIFIQKNYQSDEHIRGYYQMGVYNPEFVTSEDLILNKKRYAEIDSLAAKYKDAQVFLSGKIKTLFTRFPSLLASVGTITKEYQHWLLRLKYAQYYLDGEALFKPQFFINLTSLVDTDKAVYLTYIGATYSSEGQDHGFFQEISDWKEIPDGLAPIAAYSQLSYMEKLANDDAFLKSEIQRIISTKDIYARCEVYSKDGKLVETI